MPEPEAMPARITLRDASRDEAADIAALIQAAYAQYEPQYSPEGWQRYYGVLGDVSEHFDKAEVIVGEVDGVLAGVVMFYPDGALSEQGDWPEGWAGLLRLAVHPAYRGAGVSRALMEECIRRARAAGVSTLALHTTQWMTVAREMYERMGFVRDESFDFFTRSGVHAMGYRVDLDAS
jgi:GNAT superfamily N-acetyltransferase